MSDQDEINVPVPISRTRHRALEMGQGELTDTEKADGWHFCNDWDGMLIHPSDKEAECCTCHPKTVN